MRDYLRLVCLVGGLSIASAACAEVVPLGDYLQRFVSTGQQLVYSEEVVPTRGLVEVDAQPPTESGLRGLLAPLGLALAAGPADSLLIVKLTPPTDSAGGAISGVVRSANNRRIAGAKVSLGNGTIAVTDSAGYFSVTDLAVGGYTLVITAPGMLTGPPQRLQVNDSKVTVTTVTLQLAPVDLGSLVITSSRYNLQYRYPGSHTLLDQGLLTGLPSIGDDPLRATERLPGTATGGLSSRNHVRGGEVNEVLVVLDGLRLYEPFHLKDFQSPTSLISRRAIESVDYYSGGFPARYGDRMSAVMDITLRQPTEELRTELELSFFNTAAASLGRFQDGRGEWLVSARRGNLDLLFNNLEREYGEPRYADGLAHIGWQLSDRTQISGNVLFLQDKASVVDSARVEDAQADYANRYAWFRVRNDWGAALNSDTLVSVTHIDHVRSGRVSDLNRVTGSLDESRDFKVLGLKQDWDLRLTERLLLATGFNVQRLEADYRYRSSAMAAPPFAAIGGTEPLAVARAIVAAPQGSQHAVYVQGRWQWRDTVIFDAGLRWDQQSYTIASDDQQISPRFSVLLTPRPGREFRLSWGRYHQAQEVNELQLNAGLDVFFPAQRSEHSIVSWSEQLKAGLNLRLEVYRKTNRSLQPRFENLFDPLVVLPELRPDRVRIDAPSAVAQGVELLVSQNDRQRALRWWASYTWSQVKDRLPQGDVPRSWDQTHAIKAGVLWNRGAWDVGATVAAHTGWPRTSLMLIVPIGGGGQLQLVPGRRNTDRYDAFHSLDIRVNRRFDVGRGDLNVFLEVSNLYNRRNHCCTRYSIETDAGIAQLRETVRDWLPIVPSLGVAWEF